VVTTVAMLSRAAGPPWADGSINTHVSWARALPDVDFRWFGSAAWHPSEPNFRASRLGASDNTWSAKRRPLVQTIQAAFAPATDLAPLLVSRHVVAVSQRIAREVTASVSDVDVTVVHPVVDPALLAAVPRTPEAMARARAALGVAPDRRTVLYAGNWSERLGVLDALEVFALVAAEVPDVDLVVANRASLRGEQSASERAVRAEFDARVRAADLSGRIVVVGLVPDFRTVIASSAALLFPALDLREGKLDLPLVVLEALALGVPVGLYAIAPLDEFDFAPAGALVAPGDRSALATRLIELLRDPTTHDRAAAAGRALAGTAFDPVSRAPLLRGVYDRARRG
jgi:phosphatidylinositol alpha-1,6-mannosyltransferase